MKQFWGAWMGGGLRCGDRVAVMGTNGSGVVLGRVYGGRVESCVERVAVTGPLPTWHPSRKITNQIIHHCPFYRLHHPPIIAHTPFPGGAVEAKLILESPHIACLLPIDVEGLSH